MLISRKLDQPGQRAFEAARSIATSFVIRRGLIRSWTLQRAHMIIDATIHEWLARNETDPWTLARHAIFATCAELNATVPARHSPVDQRDQIRVIDNPAGATGIMAARSSSPVPGAR